MCASSAVSDYYMGTFPQRFPTNPQPFFGPTGDPEAREMLRKVMELLDKIDKKLGDVECHDDAKEAFLAKLNENAPPA